MSARARIRHIVTTVVAVVGIPVAALASLAIAAGMVAGCGYGLWLALDVARGWS